MSFPEDLKYVRSHEWVKILEDGMVLVGISDYAQDILGDLVFANLPKAGDEVTEGKPFADVEFVKAVSDVYSPVSDMVVETNEALLDAPGSISEAPHEARFMKVKNVTGTAQLMSVAEYGEYARTLNQGIQVGEGIPSHER